MRGPRRRSGGRGVEEGAAASLKTPAASPCRCPSCCASCSFQAHYCRLAACVLCRHVAGSAAQREFSSLHTMYEGCDLEMACSFKVTAMRALVKLTGFPHSGAKKEDMIVSLGKWAKGEDPPAATRKRRKRRNKEGKVIAQEAKHLYPPVLEEQKRCVAGFATAARFCCCRCARTLSARSRRARLCLRGPLRDKRLRRWRRRRGVLTDPAGSFRTPRRLRRRGGSWQTLQGLDRRRGALTLPLPWPCPWPVPFR